MGIAQNEKIYELDGKLYSELDLSETHDNYAGDLYDLYWELESVKRLADDYKIYYATGNPENEYDSYEELIEEEFDYLEWSGEDGNK